MAIYNWRKNGTDYGTPTDWINTTTGANPASASPTTGDSANFNSSGGGTVTGTGSATHMSFSTGPWTVSAQLATGDVSTTSATTFGSGASLVLLGNTNAPYLPEGGTLNSQVTLSGATLDASAAQMNVGATYSTLDPNGNVLLVQSGSTAKFLGLNVGSGASGSVTVTGTGSSLSVVRNTALETGSATSGYLSLGQRATVGNTTTTGSGTMTVTAGATASVNNGLSVGFDAGSAGTLNVSNSGVFTLSGGIAFVANLAGSAGTINIGAGGTFRGTALAQSSSYLLAIGGNSVATGATGTVNVAGSGALLDMGSNGAIVGFVGTGTLAISGGGVARFTGVPATIASLAIGQQTGAVGTVTVDGAGSQLSLSGGFYVAHGGAGSLSLTNGAALTETKVGTNDSDGVGSGQTTNGVATTPTGTFSVSSGSTATLADQLIVGQNGGSGGVTVQGSSSLLSLGDALTLGTGTTATNGNGALVVQSGGAVTMTAAADTSRYLLNLGAAANTIGAVLVTGSGSALNVGLNAAAIGNSGTGALTVSAGATVKSATADSSTRAALAMGIVAGSSGTLTVTGTGSSYTAAGGIYIGRGGTGTLSISNGGMLTAGVAASSTTAGYGLSIGGSNSTSTAFGGTGTGQVTTGGVLQSLYDLTIGIDGVTGSLLVDNSTATAGRQIQVGAGADRAGGVGTLTVQDSGVVRAGGQHILATSGIVIGSGPGNTGTATVTGTGSLLDANGDRLSIGTVPTSGSSVTGTGSGSLTVSAGGKALSGSSYADTEAALAVGAAANETGTLLVTGAGSTMVASGLAVLGGNNNGSGLKAGGVGMVTVSSGGVLDASGLAVFAGSTLTVDGSSKADIGGSSGAAGAVTVEAGATLNARGGAIAGVLAGVGTVDMSGSLTVSSATGGLTYAFTGTHRTLSLGAESGTSMLTGFGNGDVLDFAGQTSGVSVSGGTIKAGTATFTLTGAPAGTTYLVGSDGSGGTAVTAVTAAEDFNGDGKSDLLLQNSGGAIVIETQANLGVTGGYGVGNPGAAWHVVGSADFNGDGQADLLLENDNGTLVDYLMSGTTIAAGYGFGDPGSNWHVRGTGDFNGDGKADIVLQDDASDIVIYNTNGTAVTGAAYVTTPGAGWTVEGVADFNGDGTPDILVQNTNGQLVDYLMSGDAIASANYLGAPGAGWAVAGTGDYNGDGKADILLHNDNGTDLVLDTNGVSVTGATNFGNPGAAYTGSVAGVDLNGDGVTDLVVQKTDSTLVGYTLNTAGQPTAGAVLGVPGAGWTAIGNDPMQFIDGTGSAAGATIAATAGADEFNFTSFMAGLHGISGFDAAQDLVALSASTFGSYAAVQANEAAYQGGTFIALTPGSTGAGLVIQGVTPGQLAASNFVLR